MKQTAFSPEAWVTSQHPCDIQYAERGIHDSYADMVLPTLSKTRYESMDINFGGEQLVSRDEFDGVVGDCLSLYQTREGMQNANLLSHLMKYDAPEGLRLATAEMMVQGHDNGGDILRMANNVVKFKQTQVKVAHSPTYREMNRELQIYTMSLDDFIAQPAMSALQFFDFVLDQTNISPQRKEEAAMKYERYYREKIKGSRHVTHGKSGNSDQLKEYLQHDPVFGPPLRKIEILVEAALANARNGLR